MPDSSTPPAAVLVTSDSEGFGLAALEALACGVPVLSTPVGIAPFAVAGTPGCLVAPFDAAALGERRARRISTPRTRASSRARSPAAFSAERMAERVLAAYRGGREPDRPAAKSGLYPAATVA